MAVLFRRISRVSIVVAAAVLLCLTVEQRATGPAIDDSASAARETRLRKLHLVRPDLIPYPIAFEVCC